MREFASEAISDLNGGNARIAILVIGGKPL